MSKLIQEIIKDYQAVLHNDPALKHPIEPFFNYPGFYAIMFYRVFHRLYNANFKLSSRFFSLIVRYFTGIEIHPAAALGAGLFIDHGMGVVIGETAETGQNCVLFHGVTLGGTGNDTGKRHPTLGNYVTVGAGAKVLGPISIGDYVKIGANSVVLNDVPANSIVVGIPGRVVRKKVIRLSHMGPIYDSHKVNVPDPVDIKMKEMQLRIAALERQVCKQKGTGDMKVFNTLTGKKEDFVPIRNGHVGIYACGVTVYDLCHVGHARSAVFFDVLMRYMIYKGFNVTFVRNFTDIDDKIINRANEEGMAWDSLANKYIEEFYHDMDALGVNRATIEPKATEHIGEIIDIIKGLIDGGFAYTVEGGDVFFEVSKLKEYGKLSKKPLESRESGARVDVDTRKKSPHDFALWKSSKENEPMWESPWGMGRPGWHIECTAMSMKYLGETFDIHGGGADLIFPHHENELAQSEAFTGRNFVNYWVHNGFITIDKEKMSKSLGNFFTIREVLKEYDPEVLRTFLLSAHYKSPIEFSRQQLAQTEASIDRYYVTLDRVEVFIKSDEPKGKKRVDDKRLVQILETFKADFTAAMDDDFNTAICVANIFELIREINKYFDQRPKGPESRELVKSLMDVLTEVAGVLNIFQKNKDEWNRSLMMTKQVPLTEAEIEDMILNRQNARAKKEFETADNIREELDSKGVILEDSHGKTTWRIKV